MSHTPAALEALAERLEAAALAEMDDLSRDLGALHGGLLMRAAVVAVALANANRAADQIARQRDEALAELTRLRALLATGTARLDYADAAELALERDRWRTLALKDCAPDSATPCVSHLVMLDYEAALQWIAQQGCVVLTDGSATRAHLDAIVQRARDAVREGGLGARALERDNARLRALLERAKEGLERNRRLHDEVIVEVRNALPTLLELARAALGNQGGGGG